jgi:molecular chaperone GrpE (heat shock protein)
VTVPAEGDDPGARGAAFPATTEATADSGHQAPGGAGQDADPADGEAPAREPAPAPDLTDHSPATEVSPAQSQQPKTPLPEAEAEIPAAAIPSPDTPLAEAPAAQVTATETSAPESPAATIPAAELRAELSELSGRIGELAAAAAELSRLRSRDTELIARLHEDVTRLRSGEIATALNPVVTGMIKLHDQMISLGALDDPASPVGMLHTQLLQIMELTCAVRPFTPTVGERFDASHHTGTRRRPTTDASLDGTIASSIRAGFVRADGSVVRVAEVEVHRLSA